MTKASAEHGADRADRIRVVQEKAAWIRKRSLRMVHDAQLGHPGGDLSAADILATLYFDVLRHDPRQPKAPQRDRFIMSKGHATGSLYATLAAAGFFPEAALETYMQPGSRLNGHPNCQYLPGVETNTGPLGHGLPVAVGIAVAGQIDGAEFRVFVLTGDGELQEGSIWEAAMFAGHRRLANLTVIVDRNRLQQGAGTEETNALDPLADKWRAFGWDAVEVDGHDVGELLKVFERRDLATRPLCVIANTVKGNGVSFMANDVSWHHGVPTTEQLEQALRELDATEAAR